MIDLRLGDCIEVMKTLPDNSVDSVVCDPPYHLTSTKGGNKGFMGKEWDGGDIAFRTEVWKECLRVLKPGGHLLAFGGSRTYHRLAVAIEDAGFEIRDQIMWINGQGFPKSLNIGKAIDATIKTGKSNPKAINQSEMTKTDGKVVNVIQPNNGILGDKKEVIKNIGASLETNEAKDWEGWGTALKPAHEPIVMARKPLSEKSVAENVLKWGTGGINIDGCRIETDDIFGGGAKASKIFDGDGGYNGEGWVEGNKNGRFPANIMFDEEAGKLLDEQSGILNKQAKCKTDNKSGWQNKYVGGDGVNPVERKLYLDGGGASRFFYCPKASKKEKGIGNTHPTIKPIALMEYLIKLITPKGGVVMDCFMGSGSTGISAIRNGYSFLGIEKETEYMDIAKQRINYENSIK